MKNTRTWKMRKKNNNKKKNPALFEIEQKSKVNVCQSFKKKKFFENSEIGGSIKLKRSLFSNLTLDLFFLFKTFESCIRFFFRKKKVFLFDDLRSWKGQVDPKTNRGHFKWQTLKRKLEPCILHRFKITTLARGIKQIQLLII